MMQNLFNKHILKFAKGFAGIAGLALMFSPMSALAAPAIGISSSTRPDTSVRGVCLRLVSLEGSMSTKLISAQTIYAAGASSRMLKLKSLAENRNSEDAATRKASDQRMNAYMATLRAKAKGDANKENAVDAFSSTVLKATSEKRSAIDASLKTFTDGVKALASVRDQEVKAQAAALSLDIKGAISAAQASCGSGSDPKDVRDSLHKALASITTRHKTSLDDRTALYEGLQSLTDARKRTVKEATDAYTQKLNQASQDLHSVVR